jgi:hypothetical protein
MLSRQREPLRDEAVHPHPGDPVRVPARMPRHQALQCLTCSVEDALQASVDIVAYPTALLTRLPAHSVRRIAEWLPRPWQQARATGLAR